MITLHVVEMKKHISIILILLSSFSMLFSERFPGSSIEVSLPESYKFIEKEGIYLEIRITP